MASKGKVKTKKKKPSRKVLGTGMASRASKALSEAQKRRKARLDKI